MHWPAGWAEQNLPSLQRLKRNGLYFLRAYTAACECSPSRGVMQTGRFAPINRVPSTAVLWPGLVHQRSSGDHRLPAQGARRLRRGVEGQVAGLRATPRTPPQATAARRLGAGRHQGHGGELGVVRLEPAGCGHRHSAGAGGLHLFGVFNGNNTAGGGNPNNDGRYVSGTVNATPGQIPGVGGESVVEFLQARKGSSNPFCLFVSLVNPHDIGASSPAT